MMKKLHIEGTRYSPRIELDPETRTLLIEGDSYPENAVDVYGPLITALDEYFEQPNTPLNIKMLSFFQNTSSSKMITDMLAKLQRFFDQGHPVELTWFYPSDDLEIKDTFELFLEDASFPYSITQLEE